MKTIENFGAIKRGGRRLFVQLSVVVLFAAASLLVWQTAGPTYLEKGAKTDFAVCGLAISP